MTLMTPDHSKHERWAKHWNKQQVLPDQSDSTLQLKTRTANLNLNQFERKTAMAASRGKRTTKNSSTTKVMKKRCTACSKFNEECRLVIDSDPPKCLRCEEGDLECVFMGTARKSIKMGSRIELARRLYGADSLNDPTRATTPPWLSFSRLVTDALENECRKRQGTKLWICRNSTPGARERKKLWTPSTGDYKASQNKVACWATGSATTKRPEILGNELDIRSWEPRTFGEARGDMQRMLWTHGLDALEAGGVTTSKSAHNFCIMIHVVDRYLQDLDEPEKGTELLLALIQQFEAVGKDPQNFGGPWERLAWFEQLLDLDAYQALLQGRTPFITEPLIREVLSATGLDPSPYLSFDGVDTDPKDQREIASAIFGTSIAMMRMCAVASAALIDVQPHLAETILEKLARRLQDHESWRQRTFWEVNAGRARKRMNPFGEEPQNFTQWDFVRWSRSVFTLFRLADDHVKTSPSSRALEIWCLASHMAEKVLGEVWHHFPTWLWGSSSVQNFTAALDLLPGRSRYLAPYLQQPEVTNVAERARNVVLIRRALLDLSFQGGSSLRRANELEDALANMSPVNPYTGPTLEHLDQLAATVFTPEQPGLLQLQFDEANTFGHFWAEEPEAPVENDLL